MNTRRSNQGRGWCSATGSFALLAGCLLWALADAAIAQPLASWNDGPAKQAIVTEMRAGAPVLVKLPQIDLVDDRAGKPIGIQKHIGRRPIAAFGNSDGDLEMLQWTMAAPGPRLAVIVRHTDAEREWAYDRKLNIGTLDKA